MFFPHRRGIGRGGADQEDSRVARARVENQRQRLRGAPDLDVDGVKGVVLVAARLELLCWLFSSPHTESRRLVKGKMTRGRKGGQGKGRGQGKERGLGEGNGTRRREKGQCKK